MARLLKILFFAVLIRPLVLIFLGLNIRGRNNLPMHGPAIIAANHNSHLDTMVLMSLYPLSRLHRVRPVAAADYFLRNRFLRWFSLKCVGIIPLERGARKRSDELFAGCHEALDAGDILIIFPEGSRGEPELRGKIKKGLFRIVNERTDTTVVPVMMHGLGRSLPRGEALLVPFNCDVIIGEPMPSLDSAEAFVEWVENSFDELLGYCVTRAVPDNTD
jgi:1-acyl-sn-glycerol-3-phosphate acyltransferase